VPNEDEIFAMPGEQQLLVESEAPVLLERLDIALTEQGQLQLRAEAELESCKANHEEMLKIKELLK